MSETEFLLRLAVQGTKEIKTTAVEVHGDAEKFTSQMTEGEKRKRLYAYNNTSASSGELVYGGSDVTPGNGIPIPKGLLHEIRVADDIDLYFQNVISGENSDLRVLEIS